MSIFLTLVGLALILIPGVNQAAQGVGIGLILAVQSAWFIPGAARMVAHEVGNQVNQIQQVQPPPQVFTSEATTTTVDGQSPTQKLQVMVKPQSNDNG